MSPFFCLLNASKDNCPNCVVKVWTTLSVSIPRFADRKTMNTSAAPSDSETIPRTMITVVSILISYLGLGPSLSLRHPSKPLGLKAVCEVFVRFQEQLELVRVNNQVF